MAFDYSVLLRFVDLKIQFFFPLANRNTLTLILRRPPSQNDLCPLLGDNQDLIEALFLLCVTREMGSVFLVHRGTQ